MMMKCIAIDDEPLALQQIGAYISRIPYLQLLKLCDDVFEAQEVMAKDTVDLMFVDINMPDLNGMDFVRSLVNKPMVVFTTAYSEYAVDGYKVDAIDYLLKPFGFKELMRASEKALRLYEFQHSSGNNAETEQQPTVKDDALFVKGDHKILRIDIPRIKYIESMSEYIRIYVDGESKPVMVLGSLQKLEERLPQYFMRVHRSYIVNMKKITEVSRLRIIFDKETYIPISDNYKDKFNEYINKQILP
jgi:DNA-binding LytR/AlgR family response regulator